jgi:NTE family protein
MKVLHGAGAPLDLIVGASAGALIGPLYAVRRDADEAERIAASFTPTEFLDWFLRDLRVSPQAGRIGRSLWQSYGRLDFRELEIPFAAVALDLAGARPVVLRTGNVGRAVEASIRPPLFGSPIEDGGRALVDGGLHNTVPVSAARELGASTVISVNVGEFLVLPRRLRPLAARVGVTCRARSTNPADISGRVGFLAGLFSKGHPRRDRADIEIRPDMRGISPMWPWHTHAAMQRGETAARRALPAIRRLLSVRAG